MAADAPMGGGRPGWRVDLERALAAGGSEARYAQLATAGPDGAPHNRTIVFRGFAPDSDALLFVTDGRSAKIGQIEADPRGALCWYFRQAREQFRIRGDLRLIGPAGPGAELRAELWRALSAAIREQFFWLPPGRKKGQGQVGAPRAEDAGPPEWFIVLRLSPESVDHLRLDLRPHRRRIYEGRPDGEWECREVNP